MKYDQFESAFDLVRWIEQQKRIVPKVSLKKMEYLCSLFENPHKKVKYIHVGGTNGKGSTVSFIKSILMHAGYCVGAYISPYVLEFNERISINNIHISNEELVEIGNEIISKYSIIEESNVPLPTFFEFVTILAFIYFSKHSEIDVVLCEVGLGGLLDSTNVIIPIASVITNVHYDHMNVLGNTLEEIALNKLGIVKDDIPLFSIHNSQLEQLFTTKTKEKNSPLFFVSIKDIHEIRVTATETSFSYKKMNDIRLGLIGKHQTENAALAIELSLYLNSAGIFNISNKNIYDGLYHTFWPGRLQIIRKDPLWIIDGAHNEDGIRRLIEFIHKIKNDKFIQIVFAVSHDKDKQIMIKQLETIADEMVFTHFEYKRSDQAEALYDISIHPNKRFENNLEKLINESVCEKNKWIIYCGSLYFISETLQQINKLNEKKC